MLCVCGGSAGADAGSCVAVPRMSCALASAGDDDVGAVILVTATRVTD